GRLRVSPPHPAAVAGLAGVVLVGLALAGGLPVVSEGGGSAEAQKISRLPGALTPGAQAKLVKTGADPSLARSTACRQVVYIGDSTSDGETSTDYIPNASQRLPAQLTDVGVNSTVPLISGARAIIESFEGEPGAAVVAQRRVATGFNG